MRYFLLLLLLVACSTQPSQLPPTAKQQIQGLTLVAPPKPFPESPMPAMRRVGARWVALTPYAFSPNKNSSKIVYDLPRQWWGERVPGIERCVELARADSLKIMLKPQVWIPGAWVGDVQLDKEDFEAWAVQYSSYLLRMARIAAEQDIELLCIGTEYDQLAQRYPDFWRKLIVDIRAFFKGELCYAANWDAYQDIPFWKELDYIGVNAYFPLSSAEAPSVAALCKAWRGPLRKMKRLSTQEQRPILFTEWGYLTVPRCSYRTWELEQQLSGLPVDEQAQANAYEALIKTFSEESWWAGGFIWKWYGSKSSNWGEGNARKDYSPRDKAAATVLQQYWLP